METQESAFSLMELFKMGGAFMWPLLLFSIAASAISLERVLYLLYHNLRLDDLQRRAEEYIRDGDFAGAQEYLKTLTRRRIGARILLALVRKPELSEHQMEKAVEAEAMTQINALENGFNFLTALGSLSPLTGFLGTVSGMIGAFKSIAEATEVNAQIVANGIYEALITTVFGLIIALIAMIFHSLFTHVVDKFAADVEKTCSELITEIALTHAVKETAPQAEPPQAFLGLPLTASFAPSAEPPPEPPAPPSAETPAYKPVQSDVVPAEPSQAFFAPPAETPAYKPVQSDIVPAEEYT
ncbi:MAG: MotA/TolQ/ExbB proton channel family protein [Spirochaetaceae bacterium]|jgi:biopolymer transport protein ExbB|nr:MotA/TolQ/ExbB proton channel family protein [Spirochaetaceae bacterium]